MIWWPCECLHNYNTGLRENNVARDWTEIVYNDKTYHIQHPSLSRCEIWEENSCASSRWHSWRTHRVKYIKPRLPLQLRMSIVKALTRVMTFFKIKKLSLSLEGGWRGCVLWLRSWTLPLILPVSTKVPYANSFDPDETYCNSASCSNPSCLHSDDFHQLLMTLKALWKL